MTTGKRLHLHEKWRIYHWLAPGDPWLFCVGEVEIEFCQPTPNITDSHSWAVFELLTMTTLKQSATAKPNNRRIETRQITEMFTREFANRWNVTKNACCIRKAFRCSCIKLMRKFGAFRKFPITQKTIRAFQTQWQKNRSVNNAARMGMQLDEPCLPQTFHLSSVHWRNRFENWS